MTKGTTILSCLVMLSLFLSGNGLQLNDQCSNPNGDSGRCIHLRECQPLKNIYDKPRVSFPESSFVMASKCGMDGRFTLVCCVLPDSTDESCGIDNSDRIFGGSETDLDEFPWTALIRYRKSSGNLSFDCGGSLINSRYVITAAHCFNLKRGMEVVGVRLGEHKISNEGKDCKGCECADVPVDMNIERIVIHEDYDANLKNRLNDIALIRLDMEVPLSDYIQPICLPFEDSLKHRNIVGHKLTAAGWGRTETGEPSDTKLKVNLEIKDPENCSAVYKPAGVVFSNSQLCAGSEEGKDTCNGDSGGPLMQRVEARWVLYGITSFGLKKCALKGVPGVYTSVAKYTDWIRSKI